jgi:hypothetical protein
MTAKAYKQAHEQRMQKLTAYYERVRQEEREMAERERERRRNSRMQASQQMRQRMREKMSKPVVALHPDGTPDESRTWPSAVEASLDLGCCPSAVREAIKWGWACRGVYLAYAGHPPPALKGTKLRSIVRLSDGRKFDSMSKILDRIIDYRAYRTEHGKISRAIRGGTPYRGEFYVYAEHYQSATADQATAPSPCGRIEPERSAVLADGQRRAI